MTKLDEMFSACSDNTRKMMILLVKRHRHNRLKLFLRSFLIIWFSANAFLMMFHLLLGRQSLSGPIGYNVTMALGCFIFCTMEVLKTSRLDRRHSSNDFLSRLSKADREYFMAFFIAMTDKQAGRPVSVFLDKESMQLINLWSEAQDSTEVPSFDTDA